MTDIAANPFVGKAYVADVPTADGVRRIAYPHNQYLSYAVRAGVLAPIAFLLLVFHLALRLNKVRTMAHTVMERVMAVGFLSVIAGVCLVSNMLQENFIQSYTACVLWTVLGLAEGLAVRVIPIASAETEVHVIDGRHPVLG